MRATSKFIDTDYEIKYITIPVPENLAMLTTVMLYEDDKNGGISVNTVSYATKELKELDKDCKIDKVLKYIEEINSEEVSGADYFIIRDYLHEISSILKGDNNE